MATPTLISVSTFSPSQFAAKITFIDQALPHSQLLLAGLKPGITGILLDPSQDGITQITKILATGIFSEIHILSHGNPGTLQLGTAYLNLTTLQTQYTPLLQQWRHSLTPDGTILLYGCQVAAPTEETEEIHPLLWQLHSLTGAKIAASQTKTGCANLGGNWQLETKIGDVKNSLAVETWVQDAYPIGTNATATGLVTGTPFGNGGIRGVLIANGAQNNQVGGSTAAERNIVSGNRHTGVELVGTNTNNNRIQGNYIGTDINGTTPLGNGNVGVQVFVGPQNNIIGTDSDGSNDSSEGNLISGNGQVVIGTGDGITVAGNTTSANIIAGNRIGTDVTGTNVLGNNRGVFLNDSPDQRIGGILPVAQNVISGNNNHGIVINGNNATGNRIQGNSIFNNGQLGIDLGANGITINDDGDTDIGSNNLQNFPVLLAAEPIGGNTVVLGTFNSTPGTPYRLEFFSNTNPDPSGNGEGETFHNFLDITTDVAGNANFVHTIPTTLINQYITATATNLITNDTSEFSNASEVRVPEVTLTALAPSSQNEADPPVITPYQFAVTLSQPSSQPITVNYSTNDGTATLADNDYVNNDGILTFDPSLILDITAPPFDLYDVANLTQTITVNVNGDTKFEIDEDFSVEIDSVTNATIHPTDNQSTAIIVNDDPLPQVSLSLTNSPFAENGGIAILTATLSNLSSQDLTVNLDYTGTASHGVDYNAPTTIITPADNLTGIINLTGIDDNITEGDETVIVNIANVINGTENGIQEVTAIITDDDPPPTVTLSLSNSPFAETGGMATITATLSNPSSEDVTISLGFSGTAENGIDYSASDNTILIPADEGAGTLTLTGINDNISEGSESIIVDITNVLNGVENNNQQVTAIINDDYPPSL